MSPSGHLRHFERPLKCKICSPIATKNGEPLKRRRRARSRRRAAGRERQAPVEGPAPPLAWPVVHSAAEQATHTDRAPLPAALDDRRNRRLLHRPRRQRAGARLCLFEDERGRRAAVKLLTRDGARRIAANINKLPELLLLPGRCRIFATVLKQNRALFLTAHEPCKYQASV